MLEEPLRVFCSVAPEDEALCSQLHDHLRLLERQHILDIWYPRLITAGTNWTTEIDEQLANASIILLLISPSFFASDYCYGVEMQTALRRHEANEARIIPILLRPVNWQAAPFAHLSILPDTGKSVTQWSNRDAAFSNIAVGISRVIEELTESTEQRQNMNPFISNTERVRLVDLYLKQVVALTKPLPWGYLPGDFTSELEIDDVYHPPRLSSKEYRHVNVADERLERELLLQLNQNQEKEEKERRFSFKKRIKPSYSSLYDIVQSGDNVRCHPESCVNGR